MISTNQSDLSLNNQLIEPNCRQLRHKKQLKKSICSLRPLITSYNEQMITNSRKDLKSKCSSSGQKSKVRIPKTLKYEKVKSSAKNDNKWTCRLSTRFSHYLKSFNMMTNYRPMCYLIELIGRCWRPWIKSAKATGDGRHISSSLPYKAITRNNSRTQESYKSFNRSSYFPSLSLNSIFNMYSPLLALVVLISFIFRITEACSSRSTPKPRPPSPTTRPNITFQTYACPEAYAKWYCLNGATCFSVRIGESILYNCECADGYMGQRCEFKDLDGSYLPSREKVLVETASIAGGVTVAVLLMVFISIFYYTYLRQRKKEKRMSNMEIDVDELDRKPFSRVDSLKSGSTRNIFYNYREDYSRYSEHKRLQDLECGNNLVQTLLRPIILTSETCDQNYDK